MKCEDCLKVIEEYFDGELPEREAASVGAHVASCEACAHQLEALHDEQNLYALYRREVEVSPALWTGVAARIHEEKRLQAERPLPRWRRRLAELFGTPRLSPAFALALLILAVGATAGLMKYMNTRSASTQAVAQKQPEKSAPVTEKPGDSPVNNNTGAEESGGVKGDNKQIARQDERNEVKSPSVVKAADRAEIKRSISGPEGFTGEETPDQLVREAEQKYRAAIALLARDAKRRRTLLEPDVLARFDQTLDAVDRTIIETRRAARQQPDDPVAVQYMLAAYAKKVEVLREMATYKAYDRDIQ
ncbi:MAG TPA: zf-HC2 domain-containing protein [Pyrinomonadaceae bacterium]|jgi:hypothetical protein|nr:zf-HC2 domain-containing protein [Pyrinomonadaceae bacterium]